MSKFKALKRRLGIPFWQTVGLLESLWHITQMNAAAGDIGKLTNEEIAAELEWDGDPDSLIKTLVDLRWLDEDPEFRLVVHNWSKHVSNGLVNSFKCHGKQFADVVSQQRAKQVAKQPAKQVAIAGSLEQPAGTILPTNQTNQTRPTAFAGANEPPASTPAPKVAVASDRKSPTPSEPDEPIVFPKALDSPAFRENWLAWKKHRREIKKPLTATQAVKTLAMLGGIGLERATRAIEYTIAMGWQGLREPDASAPVAPLKKPSRVYDPAEDGGEYDPYSPTGIRQV